MTTNTQTRVVIRPRFPVMASAERTHLSALGEECDRTWETQVRLYLEEDAQGRKLVRIEGGPTGLEAFELTPANVQALQTQSWVASRGERGRSDRLVVPSRSLACFFAAHGIEVVAEVAA